MKDNSSKNNTASTTSSSRYKTELCRPFEEFGYCKYAEKCQFAHGHYELRKLSRHPKYKTELCKTFHTMGLCPYGHRCHFIHNQNEVTEQGQVGTRVGYQKQPAPHSPSNSSANSPTQYSSSNSSTSSTADEQLVITHFYI